MACSFEGDDPHLKSPGYEVQLHGAQHRPASFVSRDYFRAQPVDEDAASAIFRQMETYRGARNRPAGFLRYL